MPNSPITRWTVRLVAAVLVAALVALLALRIYGSERLAAAEREFAARVGSREAAPSASVSFLDEENAALLLRGGAEAMILPGNDKPLVGEASMTPSCSWSESQRADLRRIREQPARAGVATPCHREGELQLRRDRVRQQERRAHRNPLAEADDSAEAAPRGRSNGPARARHRSASGGRRLDGEDGRWIGARDANDRADGGHRLRENAPIGRRGDNRGPLHGARVAQQSSRNPR